jgi:orotidine-5'-phosphate decarboxylase
MSDMQAKLQELNERWAKLWDNVETELEAQRVAGRQIMMDAYAETKRSVSRDMLALFWTELQQGGSLRADQRKGIHEKIEELVKRIDEDNRTAHGKLCELAERVRGILASWEFIIREPLEGRDEEETK